MINPIEQTQPKNTLTEKYQFIDSSALIQKFTEADFKIVSSYAARALDLGFRVAAVFDSIPDQAFGLTLVDGDEHDIRFLNPRGALVALKAKGRARKDLSGFVIRGVN